MSRDPSQTSITTTKANQTPTKNIELIINLKEIPLKVDTAQVVDISYDRDEEKSPLKQLIYSFFLFVNPTSGGNAAAMWTKIDVEKMKFSTFTPKGATVEVLFYNLKDDESKRKGFERLYKKQQKSKSHLRVIVGGGDGTIMWVIEEMIKYKIDFEKCAIGTLPYGTGNDFSRVLGWGHEVSEGILGANMTMFKNLIKDWVEATVEYFDVWEVCIETRPEGSVQRVVKDKKGVTRQDITIIQDGKEVKQNKMIKKMANYWSVGIDARIGFGFDKNRTQSKCGNKMVYCWEGFKKMFVKTAKINSIVEGIRSCKQEETHEGEESPDVEEIQLDVTTPNQPYLLLPRSKLPKSKQAIGTGNYLKDDPSSLLFLNIPSFMGGAADVWRSSKGKVGIVNSAKKSPGDFGDQKFYDGLIEVLTYSDQVALAMERGFPGRANRVGQYDGPLSLQFKEKDERGNKIVTYTQIDGEYFKIIAPKQIKLQACPEIPKGKIRVLLNNNLAKK